MEELYRKIETQMESFRKDHQAGNKAAARRARAASNELTKLLKEYRKLSVIAHS